MQEQDEKKIFESVPTEEFLGAAKRSPERIFLIAPLGRPGVSDVVTELEWSYFRPDTPANDDLELVLVRFPNADSILQVELTWAVLSFPKDYLEVIQEGLRKHVPPFQMNPGIPRILSKYPSMPLDFPALIVSPECLENEVETFPLEMAPNIYTIEGVRMGVVGLVVPPSK